MVYLWLPLDWLMAQREVAEVTYDQLVDAGGGPPFSISVRVAAAR